MTDMEFAMKNDNLLHLCIRWLSLKNRGKGVEEYFVSNKIHSIAIYGCGEIGKLLMEELKDSGVDIVTGIDLCAGKIDAPVDIVAPVKENADRWNPAEAIVITSPYFYNDIYKVMKAFGYRGRLLALDDILMSI